MEKQKSRSLKRSQWKSELHYAGVKTVGSQRPYTPPGHLFRSFSQTSQFCFGGIDWREELEESGFIVPEPAPPLLAQNPEPGAELDLEFRLSLLHDGSVLSAEFHPHRIELVADDDEFSIALTEAAADSGRTCPKIFWPVHVTFEEVTAWRFFKTTVVDGQVDQLRILDHSVQGNLKRLDEFYAAVVRKSGSGTWMVFINFLIFPAMAIRHWDPVTRSGITIVDDVVLAIECRSVTISSDHEAVWKRMGGDLDVSLVDEAYLRREKRFGVKRLDFSVTQS